ncbi:hypothetical protein CK203_091560 [Vitis vinifera]|uniref:Reverse transcriptase zinc-binding domain-containing protein n=1 Tax=Vitis vinifera TaxID=29760 RepID=A0A438EDJ3_VITVI|nr:hypothetical protein CK203_091560 [Vitis vinifera]
MKYLSWILIWFEAISRLRINLDKSELIPVGCVENVKALAVELGCKVGRLPSSYLGLPLGAPFKFMATWDGVEKSLPIYFMFGLILPRTIRLRFANERGALWNQVIKGKYEEKQRATTKDVWVKDVWSFTKGVGTHISLDPSMIRKWMRRTIFYWVSMGRVFNGMWKIGCFG